MSELGIDDMIACEEAVIFMMTTNKKMNIVGLLEPTYVEFSKNNKFLIYNTKNEVYKIYSIRDFFDLYGYFNFTEGGPIKNGIGLLPKSFVSLNIGQDNNGIENALNTYITLLKHPLVATAEDGIVQYYIDSRVSLMKSLAWKAEKLSPFFNSEKDCEKAIDDIGKERILSMFKALKGF